MTKGTPGDEVASYWKGSCLESTRHDNLCAEVCSQPSRFGQTTERSCQEEQWVCLGQRSSWPVSRSKHQCPCSSTPIEDRTPVQRLCARSWGVHDGRWAPCGVWNVSGTRSPTEVETESVDISESVPIRKLTLQEIKSATEVESELQALAPIIPQGWPERRTEVPSQLQFYFPFREDF